MTNGTRRGWGVSVTPRPLFTPRKGPVPIVQEAGWAAGPVWTGAENLTVLTGNNAGLRTVLSSRLWHTELRSSLREVSSVSSVYLPTPWWHPREAHPFLAVHSADEHCMIYSFSNTTSCSTFYAFFSFWLTLWPMWLANSKWQPCFYPPQSCAQEDTQKWQKKKLTNLMGERTFSSVFRAVFLHS